jgi:N-acetylmuramoyl-L-alanine amidase
MAAGAMTRRSMLAAAAGAIAGGVLARPSRSFAAPAAAPAPALESRWLGALPAGVHQLELARGADLLGLEWRAPADASVALRFRYPDGRWSAWAPAGLDGHGPDRPGPAGSVVGEPIWTGGTASLQLRTARAMSAVQLHTVDVSAGAGARERAIAAAGGPAGTLPLAGPPLAAGAGQPPIIARRAWAQGVCHPRVAPGYGAVKLAFVHHTENPNGYSRGEVPAMLRAIFAFHRYVRGWNDIGYNFAIDAYGRIFEARAGGIDEPVTGAQAGGYNLLSSGVAVLGTFTGSPISPPAERALEQLLAWKLSLHGRPAAGRVRVRVDPAGALYSRFPANALVSLPRIAGHRDADSTDCPGDSLYHQLPAIRSRVRTLAPRPLRATLTLASQPPGALLSGALNFLDGSPLGGAPVLIQVRSSTRHGELVEERTIAQATTDAQGRWSLPASLSPAPREGTWLRALHPPGAGPGPAAVSDPLHLPALALRPAAPPAAPAGRPTPAAARPRGR